MAEAGKLNAAVADRQKRTAQDGKRQEGVHPREVVQWSGDKRYNAVKNSHDLSSSLAFRKRQKTGAAQNDAAPGQISSLLRRPDRQRNTSLSFYLRDSAARPPCTFGTQNELLQSHIHP